MLLPVCSLSLSCFFFTATAPTEIYTLSLHDALPISRAGQARNLPLVDAEVGMLLRVLATAVGARRVLEIGTAIRSEEHTSELQSHSDLVCRLLLEKKKKKNRATGNQQPLLKKAKQHT